LSICRDIIESHSGRIRVASLVRRGTTFTVKLPRHTSVSCKPTQAVA
jgi:signal transduction histidine kinase